MIRETQESNFPSRGEIPNYQERHGAELRDYQRKLLQSQPRPKFSRELLDLRRIQEHLAKAKDYAEAHKMKLKSDALEAWELEKWRNKRQADLCQRESKFKHAKAQEMAALLQRVMAGREEQKKQRQMDLERLLQRYQNVKSELEAQQKLERIRAERQASCMGKFFGPPAQKTVTRGKAVGVASGGCKGRGNKQGA